MIPSISPGRDVPVIETPVEIESGRVSAVSLLLKGAQTPTDPQMVPTGHPSMPTGRRAKAVDRRPEAALSWLRRATSAVSRSKPGSSSPHQGLCPHARKAVDKSPGK
jgi:hypothetical protein